MNATDELRSEVSALKTELELLRAEMESVIRIHRDDDGTIVDKNLSCTLLNCETIVLMGEKKEVRGMFTVDDDGPGLSLFGEDGQARLMVRVSNDRGTIEILDHNLKEVVAIYADPDQQGHVAVFSPGGIPRVVMKATETGGALSALSPEGNPLAVLHSLKGMGELGVLADKKVKAKIFAAPEGGSIRTFDKEGKGGTALICAAQGNTLMMFGSDGKESLTLMGGDAGSAIALGAARENGTDRAHRAVEIMDLPGFGGHMRFYDGNGRQAIDIGCAEDGGEITIESAEAGGKIALGTAKGGGRIAASRADKSGQVTLLAAKDGGIVLVDGHDNCSAALAVQERGGIVNISKGNHMQGALTVGEDPEAAAIMLTNPDNSSAVHLFANKQGGALMLGGSDGTMQAACSASEEGGQLTLFNELAVERVTITSKRDGGGMHLKWGGTTGVLTAATERGGVVLVHDPEGKIVESLPAHGWEEDGENAEDDA